QESAGCLGGSAAGPTVTVAKRSDLRAEPDVQRHPGEPGMRRVAADDRRQRRIGVDDAVVQPPRDVETNAVAAGGWYRESAGGDDHAIDADLAARCLQREGPSGRREISDSG